jgi:hypothetical protein
MLTKQLTKGTLFSGTAFDKEEKEVEFQEPAPYVDPPDRNLPRIPTHLRQRAKETGFGRIINSTLGRMFVFVITFLFMCLAAWALVAFREPENYLSGASLPMFLFAVICLLMVYCVIPVVGKKAGMAADVDGYDWKPYLVCYRCSFLAALPGLICVAFGFGAATGFGTREGDSGRIRVAELTRSSLKFFESSDGFVALNLTKGVVETLRTSEHGPEDSRRQSRFRNAELRINKEPFSDVPEPTIPPGAVKMYKIAPVFPAWKQCATLYDISQQCLFDNQVVAWVFSKTSTICSSFGMVSCLQLDTSLDPMYHCSSGPRKGSEQTTDISGFCGRVVEPPPPSVVDELGAILKYSGWPESTLPTTEQVWIDIQADECINNPQSCLGEWNLIGSLGMFLLACALFCIVVSAFIDFETDKRIRNARQFYELKSRPPTLGPSLD